MVEPTVNSLADPVAETVAPSNLRRHKMEVSRMGKKD
jgi:hypothetical protein